MDELYASCLAFLAGPFSAHSPDSQKYLITFTLAMRTTTTNNCMEQRTEMRMGNKGYCFL